MEDEEYIEILKKEPTEQEIISIKANITKEKNKLLKIFSSASANVKKMLMPLIENAAYMKCELKRLKDYNVTHGIKEFYQNGKGQWGYKESVESKTYNIMIKNYSNIIKQLNEYLPEDKKIDPDEEDDFDNFCNGG